MIVSFSPFLNIIISTNDNRQTIHNFHQSFYISLLRYKYGIFFFRIIIFFISFLYTPLFVLWSFVTLYDIVLYLYCVVLSYFMTLYSIVFVERIIDTKNNKYQ